MANLFSIAPIPYADSAKATINALRTDVIPGSQKLADLIYELQNIARVSGSTHDSPLGKKIAALVNFYDSLGDKLKTETTAVKVKLNYAAGADAAHRLDKIPDKTIGQIAAINVAKEIEKEILYSEALYPTDITMIGTSTTKALENIKGLLDQAKTSSIMASGSSIKALTGL